MTAHNPPAPADTEANAGKEMTAEQSFELHRCRLKSILDELMRAAGRARRDGREEDNDVIHRAADMLRGDANGDF